MLRQAIRRKAHSLVKKHETNNPFEICKILGVPIYYKDLGKNIMGLRSELTRAPMILLNTRNTEDESLWVCNHELGHHCCGHKNNADALTRKNLRFIAQGDEYEANCFMVELILYGVNLADYPTRQALLTSCGIPSWAESYIDWDYLNETADFTSFNSYY